MQFYHPGKKCSNFCLVCKKIAAHSAYEMFSWYMYLIVSLFFSHLGFWSGNLFLIAPFPDLCLLVLFVKFEIGECEYFNF